MDFSFIRYAFGVNRLNPIKNQTIDISSRRIAIFFSPTQPHFPVIN